MIDFSFERATRRIGSVGGFSGDGTIDVGWRHNVFLGQPMRDNGDGSLVKKIKKAVVNRAHSDAQFINAVPQQVGFGSSEFVPKRRKTSSPREMRE